jgi:hypothetical protein
MAREKKRPNELRRRSRAAVAKQLQKGATPKSKPKFKLKKKGKKS